MAKNTNQTTTGHTGIVGSGFIRAIIVCAHSSGTIKLTDSPNNASGRVILDTYSFATGSQIIPLHNVEYYQGIFATIGGTGVSIELLTEPN